MLSRSGLEPGATLVFYGYGAALGFWLMKAHDHDDVRMLVGSREQWAQAGGSMEHRRPEPGESSYPLAVANADALSSRADVEGAIGQPGQVLLDVRSEPEFRGERFWPGATEDTGRGSACRSTCCAMRTTRSRPQRDAPRAGERRRHTRAEGDHLLHDRQQGKLGMVCPEVSAGLSRRERLLRLVGRMGKGSGHPGRTLGSLVSGAFPCTHQLLLSWNTGRPAPDPLRDRFGRRPVVHAPNREALA